MQGFLSLNFSVNISVYEITLDQQLQDKNDSQNKSW